LVINSFTLDFQRYFEKIDLMAKREQELSLEPIDYHQNKTDETFRRLLLRGTFLYDNEIYIGPRGPPLGAISSSGPNSGRGGGLSSSPQGYYVLTPFQLISGEHGNETILINRGWIPRQFIASPTQTLLDRPTGTVDIVGVVSKVEGKSNDFLYSYLTIRIIHHQPFVHVDKYKEPRFFKPPSVDHRNSKILLWTDVDTIREKTKIENTADKIPILIATNNQEENTEKSTREIRFPIQPLTQNVGEFKVTPTIHAGYAVTWFGLFGAGVYMTRKLITKGR